MFFQFLVVLLCVGLLAPLAHGQASGATLNVGPGELYARIEDAVAAAKPGDTILVHSPGEGRAYERVAVLVRTPRLRIIAADPPAVATANVRTDTVGSGPPARISLRGEGFTYSGQGPIPRAIVQFDPEADGCVLDGFELFGARNDSHNGAGVRINQANHVTIRSCTVRGNDMGIMSGGDGTPNAGQDQRIEKCLIFGNGSTVEKGQSHNLYLGGASAVISACEIHSSTVGHNIKSRAHYTRVEYSWVHDSANRELDIVDAAGDTDTLGSDAVILGCVIVKSASSTGNRGVFHFGQDGGVDRTGTLHIINSTVITPFASAAVALSSPGARVAMHNSLFGGGGFGQNNQRLIGITEKATGQPLKARITAANNAFSGDFIDAAGRGTQLSDPIRFANPELGDFRVLSSQLAQQTGAAVRSLNLPAAPGRIKDTPGEPLLRYAHPQSTAPRLDTAAPAIGAFPAATTSTSKAEPK